MTEDALFIAWATGKRVDLNDTSVSGVNKTLLDLYNEAKNMNEFNLRKDEYKEDLFKASLYLLYRKFYAQLHKRSGKKGTSITREPVVMSAAEETVQSEKGKITKAATIKKRIIPIGDDNMGTVFFKEYAKLIAKGFFPIGFVSKLFVLTDKGNGATMRAKVATVDGKKEIQFVRKIEKTIDYTVPT